MILDIEGEYQDRAYQIVSSLVTPRPIALVTTIGPDGVVNAAPFSLFNVMGSDPPIAYVTPGRRPDGTPKDTSRNIWQNHEFVINLVDEDMAEAMNKCATALPYGESELGFAGLQTCPSSLVKPPRIAEAPVALECVEWNTLEIGLNRVIIGFIKRVYLRDELFDADKKRINSQKLHIVGRMAAPHWYCRTRDRFEMVRPD